MRTPDRAPRPLRPPYVSTLRSLIFIPVLVVIFARPPHARHRTGGLGAVPPTTRGDMVEGRTHGRGVQGPGVVPAREFVLVVQTLVRGGSAACSLGTQLEAVEDVLRPPVVRLGLLEEQALAAAERTAALWIGGSGRRSRGRDDDLGVGGWAGTLGAPTPQLWALEDVRDALAFCFARFWGRGGGRRAAEVRMGRGAELERRDGAEGGGGVLRVWWCDWDGSSLARRRGIL